MEEPPDGNRLEHRQRRVGRLPTKPKKKTTWEHPEVLDHVGLLCNEPVIAGVLFV